MNITWNIVILNILGVSLFSSVLLAQSREIDQAIRQHRMGQIIIRAEPGAEVQVKQTGHEFWFGCALANDIFNGRASEADRQMYKQKFLENFNSAVTENAVKWGNMEPQKGRINYNLVEAMLTWTEAHDIPLRGHNLFWGIARFVQPWVKALSDQELEQTLQHRAETVTARYDGRFAEYDLNNEMIHGNYYEERLGADITKKMAQWAKNGDPDIQLYLNDYDILTGNKLAEYMAHIRNLLDQGVPIHGIGVQGHLHAENFNPNALKNALDSLALFDLPIKITEFNLPGQRSAFYQDRDRQMTREEEEQKAKNLVDYYKICFAHPAVDGILMWGFWAGANWIPASSLYQKDWTPTPAARAYQQLIYDQWWIDEAGKTNDEGSLKIPAFYGTYQVTIDGKTRDIKLTKQAKQVLVEF
ncbi:MAG: endo-1,4-beta-xylanase [Candidatus Cyclobacteriaceae bacterium M3_2C_046]